MLQGACWYMDNFQFFSVPIFFRTDVKFFVLDPEQRKVLDPLAIIRSVVS